MALALKVSKDIIYRFYAHHHACLTTKRIVMATIVTKTEINPAVTEEDNRIIAPKIAKMPNIPEKPNPVRTNASNIRKSIPKAKRIRAIQEKRSNIM